MAAAKDPLMGEIDWMPSLANARRADKELERALSLSVTLVELDGVGCWGRRRRVEILKLILEILKLILEILQGAGT